MTLTAEQIKWLQAPLDPACVKKPSGSFGPKGDYIEGWHAINELNRVFGFDGWSYTIDLTRDALEKAKTSKGDEQWQAAYTCVCTLKVGETVRQDVGFGSGFAKGIGDAIEGATKEAATDALKRAARTFGNIFGLALYDKSRANVSAPEPPPPATITEAQITELIAMLDAMNVPVGPFLQMGNISDLSEVPAAQFEAAKGWITKQTHARQQQKEPA